MRRAAKTETPPGHCDCRGGEHRTSFISVDGVFVSLTPQQMEVLKLLQKGFSTNKITETLGIAWATTRNHIQAIMTKLGVHSRVELVALVTGQDWESQIAKGIELAEQAVRAQDELASLVAAEAKKVELRERIARAEEQLALRRAAEEEMLQLEAQADRLEAELARFSSSNAGMAVK